jgi:FkbM family methyltransferase
MPDQGAALRVLHQLLAIPRLTHVVDIGANPIGAAPPYRRMLEAGLCRVTGFEPQPAALEALNRSKGPLETYLPWVVGDGGAHTLNVCRHSGLTSLLAPDAQALETFTLLRSDAQVLEQVQVQTRRLDDIAGLEPIDFLKLDIQGGELAVLAHAREKLREAVVVQTEISFATLYQGQAGCGEIDCELRAQGFLPFCFEQIKVYDRSPATIDHYQLAGTKQLLEADLVYVRNYFDPEALDEAQLKQLCLVMHCCYGAYDLCMTCLMRLQKLGEVSAAGMQRYVDLLVEIGALKQ